MGGADYNTDMFSTQEEIWQTFTLMKQKKRRRKEVNPLYGHLSPNLFCVSNKFQLTTQLSFRKPVKPCISGAGCLA